MKIIRKKKRSFPKHITLDYKNKNKLFTWFMAIALIMTSISFTGLPVFADDEKGAYAASQDGDGVIYLDGDKVTFCLDQSTVFISGQDGFDYVKKGVDVEDSKILFIINNSYPVLTVTQLNSLWGTAVDENTEEAYHATQYAIWYVMNKTNSALDDLVNELSDEAKDLFDKLTDAAEKATGYKPAQERFPLELTEPEPPPIGKTVDDGTVRFGPYQINSAADPKPADLKALITSVATGFSICDEDGVPYSDNIVPLGEDFYVHINPLFTEKISLKCTLSGDYAEFNYLTDAFYLVSVSDSEDGFKNQELLNYFYEKGDPDPLTWEINNIRPEPPDEIKFTITKKAGSGSSSMSAYNFPMAVYLVKDSELIKEIDTTKIISAIDGNVEIELDASDIDEYYGHGYEILIVEEWENYTDVPVSGKLETRTTTPGGVAGGVRIYLSQTGGSPAYNVGGPDIPKPDEKHYVGYRFYLDVANDADVTFTNTRTERDLTFKIEKALRGILVDESANFTVSVYLHKDGGSFTAPIVTGSISVDTPLEVTFNAIQLALLGQGYQVYVVEEWNNYTSKLISDEFFTRRTSVTSSGLTTGTDPVRYFPPSNPITSAGEDDSSAVAGGEWHTGYRFDFDCFSDTSTVTFTNEETKKGLPGLSITKHKDSTIGTYTFQIYVRSETTPYTYTTVGTPFTLNKTTAVEVSDSTIFSKIFGVFGADYIGKTFAIVETNFKNTDPELDLRWDLERSITSVTGADDTTRHFYDISASPVTRSATWDENHSFPGAELTFTAETTLRSIVFTNTKKVPTEPFITLKKEYTIRTAADSFDPSHKFQFRLFHVESPNVHKYLGTFELADGATTTNTQILDLIKIVFDDYDYINEAFIILEGFYSRHDFSNSLFDTDASSPHTGWQMVGYDKEIGDALFGMSAGDTKACDYKSYDAVAGLSVYPAYEFVIENTTDNTLITFKNRTQKYNQPEVALEKVYNGEKSSWSFKFNLYEVNGDTYKLIKAGIEITDETPFDLTDYLNGTITGSSDYYEKTYAIVENYPHNSGFGNGDLWMNTVVNDVEPAGYAALPSDGQTVTTEEYGGAFKYPGYIFTLPEPSVSTVEPTTITFTNTETSAVKRAIKIIKTDENMNPLDGAEFKIYTYMDGDVEGQEFDSKGRAALAELPLSGSLTPDSYTTPVIFERGKEYVIVETEVPAIADQSVKGKIVKIVKISTIDPTIIQEEVIVNERRGSFTFNKLAFGKPDPLNGAVFRLYKWVDGYDFLEDYANEPFVKGDIPVDAEGNFTVSNGAGFKVGNLPYGDYALIEIAPPDGGYIMGSAITRVTKVTVPSNETYKVENFIPEQFRIDVSIIKADIRALYGWDGKSAPVGLPGATFRVEALIGTSWEFVNNIPVKPGETGIYSISLLLGRYRIVERVAPTGYDALTDDGEEYYYYFDVKVVNGVMEVVWHEELPSYRGDYIIANIPKDPPKLRIMKIDGSNKNVPLDEIEFELFRKDAGNNLDSIDYLVSGETGSSGLTKSVELINGKDYLLRENTKLQGYTKAADINFKVDGDGVIKDSRFVYDQSTKTYQITITNKKTVDPGGPPGPGPDPEDPDKEDPDKEDPDPEDPNKEDPDPEDPDKENPDTEEPGTDTDTDTEEPGGNDIDTPPGTTYPDSTLVIENENPLTYIELGPDGTPLGRWTFDEDEGVWVFEEFPPLGVLPVTGFDGVVRYSLLLFVCLLAGYCVMIRYKVLHVLKRTK